MAGGVWRQLMSALQFMGLIDQQKVVKDSLGKLVKSHGTPEWGKAVKEYALPAYERIVDGLPLDRATSQQLEKCFRDQGKVDGQMLDKCIRFYLHGLKEAGVKYSGLFLIRKDRTARKPRPLKTKASPNGSGTTPKPDPTTDPSPSADGDADDTHDDTFISYPLHFKGKSAGVIRVPKKLDSEDVMLIKLTVPLIEAYAAQKAAT
jgi:hypothetical protein